MTSNSTANFDDIYKALLNRNSHNQIVIKKFLKRIENRKKVIESLKETELHFGNNHGISLPSIYRNRHKTNVDVSEYKDNEINER